MNHRTPPIPDFDDVEFHTISAKDGFKEDSVREVIIAPFLKALGYKNANIKRSLNLKHPFLRVGSQERKVELVPDYSLFIDDRFAWVLDAKSPNENVVDEGHKEQVYSYATHREIRAKFFALCNGTEFAVYRTTGNAEPVLEFSFTEIDRRCRKYGSFLTPADFDHPQKGHRIHVKI